MEQTFLPFLDQSPTAFHCTQTLRDLYQKEGFTPVSDQSLIDWNDEKYCLSKGMTSLCAMIKPKKRPKRFVVFASHTDSPMLKLKPSLSDPELYLDIYGSPLLYTFLGIDLLLSGAVVFDDPKKGLMSKLITLDEYPLFCPPLAIHLDREINTKGFHLNRQTHLRPLFSLSKQTIEQALQKHLSEKCLSYDLFLTPMQKANLIGLDHSMIASHRLDNLSSAFASFEAMRRLPSLDETLVISLFFDHEEIGSVTEQGAGSAFFYETLKRIAAHYQFSEEEFILFKNRSFAFSLDVCLGHQLGHEEKFDPHFTPKLGQGPVIKHHANQKYMTSLHLHALTEKVAKKNDIPLQKFSGRNDIPTGSTIGPMFSAVMNIPTLDIGVPLLGMHAARELIAAKDLTMLTKLLQHIPLEMDNPHE
jgi:aspartyl aminopeptidase